MSEDEEGDVSPSHMVHQALYFGQDHIASLICPNQLRMHGIQTDEIPRQFSLDLSMFGIWYDAKTVLPFELDGIIAFIPMQFPTKQEIQGWQRLELTCIRDGDPTSQRMAKREICFQQKYASAVTMNLLSYLKDEVGDITASIAAHSITNKWLNIR